MKNTRCLILLSLSLLLQACAGLHGQWNSPGEAVEQHLSQQQYSQAMEVIASVNHEHPEYDALQAQRKEILVEIKTFEADSIKLQNRYKDKQQWPQAIAIAENDIKKLPTSQTLIDSRQQLIKARNLYVEAKQLELAINQANSLPQAINNLEDIERALPDNESKARALLITQGQRSSAHNTLLYAAKKETSNSNWRKAKKYLTLANQLQKNSEANDLLASINQKIERQDRKKSKSREIARNKVRNEKLEKLKTALDDKDYLEAREISAQLESWKKQDETVALALDNYQSSIEQESSKLKSKGQKLYTKGYIDQAIENWKLALSLDPENPDLKERLQRAEKFKANINKYK